MPSIVTDQDITQKAMAKLFGVKIPAINKHLKNIFESKELNIDSVISKMEITAKDGKNHNTQFRTQSYCLSLFSYYITINP